MPALVSAAVLLGHALFALREHRRFGTTGYDLGIFGQGVRAYAELRMPASEIRTATAPAAFLGEAYPLLGDHFHPILALLAPLYALVPRVESLLIAQAALVAGSTYVMASAAGRHLGRPWAALSLGLAYGLSWGLQELVAFDFHEVAFAVPLLALACAAYLDGRWVAAAWWASGLLLVKEDLGLTAAVLGLLLLRHHRRAGLALCLGATAATGLVTLVAIPALAPDGQYGYLTQQYSHGLLDGWSVKSQTLVALLAVTAGLVLRSPLALLMLPTLAWRLTSPNPAYWDVALHYSAVLMPIAFAALIDALRKDTRLPVFIPLAVMALMFPAKPLGDLVTPEFWRVGPRESAARAAVDRVPSGVEVAASNSLAPHLTDRTRTYLAVRRVLHEHTDISWIVVDTRDPFPAGEAAAVAQTAEAAGWTRVHSEHGMVVLTRPAG
ncbi:MULTISPECIES: DUF2079 domain-containing protein [Streptomyces]|uniref:DUF2079 domain-containing protein n=1 Tax=Streptomyces sudanensis TaxID=436397 RepID=A0ABY4TCN4_9ACTN|nr:MULTISPECIES: DUF2079 domain-containing protein [Streptomyces]URN16713.1 DUF2079 domain-containing protein [Streptomyces sudanensis]